MDRFERMGTEPHGVPLIMVHPIRQIGEFFSKLTPSDQKVAKELAKKAHRMPKIDIELEVLRLSRRTGIKNYV